MKKIRVIITTLILCFILSACSHYSATMMVRMNTSTKASISFGSFNGTYKMHLNSKGTDEVYITYDATLKEGNIKVYYNFNDERLNLFEIETDGSAKGESETFTCNKTIYIIIESNGKCKDGNFKFALEKTEE